MSKEQKQKPQNPIAGSVTASKSKLIRATQPALSPDLFQSLLKVVKSDDREAKDEYVRVLGALAPSPEVPILGVKGLMRQLFKADNPFRTKIGYFSALTTGATGVMNLQQAVSSVTSATEWGTVDSLFDECYIHALELHFQPINTLGGGWSTGASAAPVIFTTGTTQTTTWNNCGLICVSIFNSSGVYSTATGMIAVPNRKVVHSGRPFKYVWRNNNRFDPRGIFVANSQNWVEVTQAGSYPGTIQIRAFNDAVLGDGAHTMTIGHMMLLWDVSFRVRA